MTVRRDTKAFPITAIKAVDTEAGTFEAVVSVFSNVDLHGDRIIPGAFANSLERWRSSGDPIPVIFSHGWHDLSNYLGTADPKDVRELMPGSTELPEVIREFGGLMVKGSIDTDEPEGRKILKLLKGRVIREFSFAYDILEEDRGDDGHNELAELDLIEVGPTLKGANPLTQLVTAKAQAAGIAFDKALEEVAKTLNTDSTELAKAFKLELDALETAETEPEAAKANVSLDGTIEAHLQALRAAAFDWARETFGDDLYWVYIEGTYPDRLVAYVELWEDPIDAGNFYEVPYTVEGDEITLGEASRVTLDLAITPTGGGGDKAGRRFGRKEGRRNSSTDSSRIQDIHNLTAELGAECETADADPDGEADDDTTEESSSGQNRAPAVLAASLAAELNELDL
jgi:hypothetical protein